MSRWQLSLPLALALGACAGMQPTAAQPEASSGIELRLADASGSPLLLSSLRGQAVVVFVFSTSDTISQLVLTHLERWLSRKPNARVLGLALQPDARTFLGPYRDALSVSFPLTYDPYDLVLPGHSELGRVEAVPVLIVLDANGVERARRYGVLDAAHIDRFVASSLGW